ncbi:MAG TPA: hypothetical protein VK851_14160, partial [Anaerolineales bacterium]|nr:hypothetical protein [Anaerolineales bacterium]
SNNFFPLRYTDVALKCKHRYIWDMAVLDSPISAPLAGFEPTSNSLEESGTRRILFPIEIILSICPLFSLKTGLFFQYFQSL